MCSSDLRLARSEAAAGHAHTALELYYQAAMGFMQAQHPIFELNDEKRFLYAGLRRTYDEVCRLAPYTIERIDINFSDFYVRQYPKEIPVTITDPSGTIITNGVQPNPNRPLILDEEGERLVSRVGASLAHDTRNNALLPTKGHRVEATGDLAGGP